MSAPPQSAPPVDAAAPLRVLAADDNAVNRMVMKALLSSFGIELKIVSDGREAVQAWREHKPELVFLDLNMPELDGLSTAREIRRLEAELDRPRSRIYALSGETGPGLAEETKDAGMDGALTKPLVRELILPLLVRPGS